jgi:type VI secretion system protein ImpA
MRLAREEAERLRDPGDPNRARLVPPDWYQLCADAAAAIGRGPPNLEVAAWWTEAAAHAEGFAGIAAGATLLAGLIRTRWDELEPRPDPDDLTGDPGRDAARIAKELLGALAEPLSTHLPAAARCVALFELDRNTPYTLESYLRGRQRAARLDEYEKLKTTSTPPDKRERHQQILAAKAAELARPEMQAWEKIVERAAGQDDVLAGHAVALAQAVAALGELRAAIAARDGEGIASTTGLAGLLSSAAEAVRQLRPAAVAAESMEPAGPAADGQAPGPARARGAAMDRDAAIATLMDIAAFFRRTEPQSPIGDVLEEIARRARLSWVDFLTEMVPDGNQRELLRERLGLPRKPRDGQ